MKSTNQLAFAVLATALLTCPAPVRADPSAPADPDAKQLVERANAVLRGASSHGDVRMTVEGPALHREYEMEGWNRGATEAKIVIHSPTQEMGVTTLRAGNDLWMFLPNVERTVRIPPTMMHSAWMGSDFNYEDIVKADSVVGAYDHRIVTKERSDGHEIFTIEGTPKPDAPVVWGKVVLRIQRDPDGQALLLREQDYSERGELIRTIELSEIETMDGRRVPTRLECTLTANPGRRTVLKYGKIQFDVKLDDEFFTLNRMRQKP